VKLRLSSGSPRAFAAAAAACAATLVGALAIVALPGAADAAVSVGTYTIVNSGSGLCLDLPGSSTTAGVQADLQSCSGAANQTWTLAVSGSGFSVSSRAGGLCLGIAGASTSAGKAVEQLACDGSANEQWTLTAVGNSFQLVDVNSVKCMNSSGNATTAGALVVQNSCDSVATKAWTLNPASGSASASPSVSATASSRPSPSASASASASPSASATGSPVTGALYVSPGGTDGAAGTLSAPTTLTSALTRIGAGGTIYMRGGTYNYTQTITIAPGNDGTASALKTLSAYPGETPVLDFSAQREVSTARGLQVNATYWHLYGLVVQHAGDNGIAVGGSHNTIERTVTRDNRDTGLQISRIDSTTAQAGWPSFNLIISCESYDNQDSAGENADGFAAKLTVGPGNVFRYDVSHNNIDDGWDLFTKTDTGAISPVTIEFSLSYDQGTLTNGTQASNGDKNGFKLGGDKIAVNHVVQHDIAFDNGHDGFTYNSNPGNMTVADDVSIDNAERNFHWESGNSVFTNDTSCRFTVLDGTNDKLVGQTGSTDQFWTGANGSRCSGYSGALGWSFASDGHLVVTFGGVSVTL
jgi:pectate disaccharide-lyase